MREKKVGKSQTGAILLAFGRDTLYNIGGGAVNAAAETKGEHMTKSERWYSSITLILALVPAICVALIQNFTNGNFILIDELNGIYKEFTSFQMNVVAIFCVIPFGFIVAARFLKERGIIGRHFWVVVSAVLAMTLAYVVVMFWIIVGTLAGMSGADIFTNIDYAALACALVCLTFSVLANFLPSLPPNPIFGVKNRWTEASVRVWQSVNSAAASAITYIFLLCALGSAYSSGAFALLWLAAGIAVYYIAITIYSYCMGKKYARSPRPEK